MSKLLYIYERDMPTVSITRNVMTNIKKFPEIKTDFVYLSDVTPFDIDSHDVVIFIRPDNNYTWKIAEKAQKAGHTVITFCDDDLLNLPLGVPTIPWRKKGLIKTLKYSDVIWSSNHYIVKKYRNLTRGKRIAVSDTIVDPKELENNKNYNESGDDTIQIVYAAAPSHAKLFESYISPVIPGLLDKYKNKISFTFISVHPDVQGINCEYVRGMPLLEYREYMKKRHFDIGVAPLQNNEFSKCKYFNKFLEYTTQGIVGIYSNTEPYTYVVKDKENGLLADNTPDSWYNALCMAIDDENLRKKCLHNAVELIKKNYSEEACIGNILKCIPEIGKAKENYRDCHEFRWYKIIYCLTRPLDWIYLFMYYLRQTGIKSVVERMKMHFREVKSYSRRKE